MKKETDVRYPHSANLFRFCRRVLDHKYGGIRVIDQDVGQILGFDPADCSHWKKGKKNVRSIHAMKSIADYLGIDEKLVVDVAFGDLDELEAYFEFNGYGAFTLDAKLFETAKKEYYRKNISSWSKEKEQEFKNKFQADHESINQVVREIHEKINFREPPLYLPEIVANYPDIQLKAIESDQKDQLPGITVHRNGKKLTVEYIKGTEIKPYMRFRIAKAMAEYFLPARIGVEHFDGYAEHMKEVESNIFVAKLLTPSKMIQQEVKISEGNRDVISHLSESFWVSKTFINRRLKDILSHELSESL